MKRGIVLVSVLLAITGIGCSAGGDGAFQGQRPTVEPPAQAASLTPTQSTSPSPTPHPRGFDPVMRDIAVEVPGFRRLSVDESRDVLQVEMTRAVADLDELESAIVARFPELSGMSIEIIDISQVYGHLTEWYTQIGALWSQPGLFNQMVYTGLNATGDLIEIGVLTEEARQAAYRGIAELGIPLDAVDVVISGPVVVLD